MSIESDLQYLKQMVMLLTSMVDDLGKNIDAIYRELDMVDEEQPMTHDDLCTNYTPHDGHVGGICSLQEAIERHRI
jgi:hypothetical protein